MAFLLGGFRLLYAKWNITPFLQPEDNILQNQRLRKFEQYDRYVHTSILAPDVLNTKDMHVFFSFRAY